MSQPAGTGTEQALRTDDLFRALANQPRRVVLFHLHQHGAATMDDLLDVVLDLIDIEREVGTTGELARTRMRTALIAYHLPLLERYGLVAYDRIHDVIELGVAPDDLGAWLDLAVRRELRWRDPEPESEKESGEEITVLIVDDDPHTVDLLEHFIPERHADLGVVTATNAPDAFSIMKGGDVDCVVSDYWMPAIDGIEFLRAVRDDYPEMPFILFTNKGSEEVASQAIANNVTAYVPKGTGPEQYDRLAQQIRRAVTRGNR
ncbi:response regulator [Natronomonas sp. EA1]|uniref:response regulator n=1 Tax=Natronomonas sp. EA1 TaxID=3421655 RepID=UPI003EB87129